MFASPSEPNGLNRTLGQTRSRRAIVLGGMLLFIMAGTATLMAGSPVGILVLSLAGLLLAVGILKGLGSLESRFGLEGIFWLAFMLAASLAFRAPASTTAWADLPSNPLQLLEPLIGVICAAFLVVKALRAGRKVIDWIRSPLVIPLLLYVLWGLTAVFSEAHRVNALLYSAELGVALGLTVVLAHRTNGSSADALELLLVVAGVAVALALALAAFAPVYAFTVQSTDAIRLGGWVMHPNQLGFLAAAASLGFLWLLLFGRTPNGRRWSLVGLAASLGVLLATRGRADLAGFALGALVLLLASRQAKWLLLAIPPALVAVALRPQWLLQLALLANRDMPSLRSSRPFLWLTIVQQTLASPERMFRGVGIGVGRHQLEGLIMNWPAPAHAHNAVFEGLLALGLPGALLILAAFLTLGWQILVLVRGRRVEPRALLWGVSAVYICLVVVSAVEASFAGRVSAYTCGYLALVAAVTRFTGEAGSGRNAPSA